LENVHLDEMNCLYNALHTMLMIVSLKVLVFWRAGPSYITIFRLVVKEKAWYEHFAFKSNIWVNDFLFEALKTVEKRNTKEIYENFFCNFRHSEVFQTWSHSFSHTTASGKSINQPFFWQYCQKRLLFLC